MRNKYIKKSLEKWERICNNEARLDKISDKCSLCSEYMMTELENDNYDVTPLSCRDCPLQKSGNGCLEIDSIWNELYCHMEDNNCDCTTLEDLNEKFVFTSKGNSVEKLCNDFKDIIEKLYKDSKS